ncbi:MAG: hypothetical protein AAFY64_04420 [Pseudomonadota bacterium]
MTAHTIATDKSTAVHPAVRYASIAAFILAALVGASLTAKSAHAAGCLSDVYHWGAKAETRWQAKSTARAGMHWKIRNRLGDTVKIERGVRIAQCKLRNGALWQCQATVVRNHCF